MFLSLVVLLPAVFAEGAEWVPVKVFFSWDFLMGGFCKLDDQCLVHSLGNQSFDGDLRRWYTLSYDNPEFLPRCINNSQYLLDYLCDKGNWTTRTKMLALSMLAYAQQSSPDSYALFCDSYENVLNRYGYEVQNVIVSHYLADNCMIAGVPGYPCINSVCVLKTPGKIALGTTLNVPVNHSQNSFLFALGKPRNLCDLAAGAGFVRCKDGEPVWYNSALNAVIWMPSGSPVQFSAETEQRIKSPLAALSSYVMSVVHKPNNPGMNFAYFPKTRLFNHIYIAKEGSKEVFGFLEKNMRPEYDPVPVDYIGVRYTGIDFVDPLNITCKSLIKKYDDNAFCENQTGAGFNIVARHRCEPGYEALCPGASPIVSVWSALTGKLRP